MKRRTLLGILLAVFLSAVFFSLAFFFSVGKKENREAKKEEKRQVTAFYLPIAKYSAEIEDISLDELKTALVEGRVVIPQTEKTSLAQLFSIKDEEITAVADNEVLSFVMNEKATLGVIPFASADPAYKTLAINGKYLWESDLTDYPLQITIEIDQDAIFKEFIPAKIVSLVSIGDVILGRNVAAKMRAYNDYTHPWLKMAEAIKDADITYADLEVPLSDRVSPPLEGMSFVAPTKSIEGIKLGGVDIVNLANNHSTNFGLAVFADTLATLEEAKIIYTGGGRNLTEAKKVKVIETKDTKIAFLSANAIIGAIGATEDRAGTFEFALKPWAKSDNEEDAKEIERLISEAEKIADVVVVGFHWGVEYETKQTSSQANLAKRAVEAGADLVIGTHPHTVQGIEKSRNSLIFYSLGNFIFDQEWSIETKQGFYTKSFFYNNRLVSSPIFTYQIEDYNQPRPTTDKEDKQIKDRLFSISVGL